MQYHCLILRRALYLFVLLALLVPIQPARAVPGDQGTVWFDQTALTNHLGGTVSALAVSDSERYVYFSRGPRFMIGDLGADLGSFDTIFTGKPLNGLIHDMVVVGSTAYLAAGEAGLVILNISDPNNMQVLSSYDLPYHTTSIALSGNFAYVGISHSGVKVFNIQNPTQPVLLSSYSGTNPVDLTVHRGRLFIADNNEDLVVYTVNSSGLLENKTTMALQGSYYNSITAENNRVVLTSYVGYLTVLDVTSLPTITTVYDKLATEHGIWHVDLDFGTIYTASQSEGFCWMTLADVEDGTINSRSCYMELNHGANRVAALDGTIYGGNTDQVVVIRASNAVKTAEYTLTLDQAKYAVLANDLLYVLDDRKLVIMEAASPNSEIGSYPGNYLRIHPLTVGGHKYLVLAHWNPAITILNVDDPQNPLSVKLFLLPQMSDDSELIGTTLYIVHRNPNSLVSIDLSDPSQPVLKDSVALPDEPRDLKVVGWTVLPRIYRRAYVAVGDAGLAYLDVSDPANLGTLSVYDPGETVYGVAVRGGGLLTPPNTIYLAEGTRVGVYSASNLNAGPQAVMEENARHVLLHSGYLVAGIEYDDVVVYDISTPLAPKKIGTAQLPGEVRKLLPAGPDKVFVIDDEPGIFEVRIKPPQRFFLPFVRK